MFAILRIGRYAVRASATRGPKQPPKEWGWFGKVVFLAIVAAVITAGHWWVPVLCVLIPLMVVSVGVALCVTAERRDKRRSEADRLAEAMKGLTGGEER